VVELTEKPDTFTVDGVAAWLRQRVKLKGVDPKLVRVNVLTVTDVYAGVPEDASEEMLDAFRRGAWWYMRCRVAVSMALMPTGKPARWLELGEAGIGKVVEGQQPGRPFVNVLEDGLPLWLELAQAAVNEAEETLETLQGVTVAWTRDASVVSADAG
jgi:hypothetical protein